MHVHELSSQPCRKLSLNHHRRSQMSSTDLLQSVCVCVCVVYDCVYTQVCILRSLEFFWQ